MKKNEGSIDRSVRVLAGVVLLSLAFVGPETPFGFLGIIPLTTGLVGWCPLYKLLGINTCHFKTLSQNVLFRQNIKEKYVIISYTLLFNILSAIRNRHTCHTKQKH